MAIPPQALTEIGQDAERLTAKDDPVPVALEERLDALLAAAPVISQEPTATTAEEPPFLAASPAADPSSHNDHVPLNQGPGDHATYSARNRARAHGFLLVVVLVAVAGAVYLAFVNPTHPPSPRTMTDGGSTTAPESASSAPAGPAEPAGDPKKSSTEDRRPIAGPPPSSADSSEASVTARDSSSLGAAAAAPTGPAPYSADAQAPSHAGAAELLGGATAKISKAHGNGDPRRTVTQNRTKEQADRDAVATQRLIARELSNSQ